MSIISFGFFSEITASIKLMTPFANPTNKKNSPEQGYNYPWSLLLLSSRNSGSQGRGILMNSIEVLQRNLRV